MTASSQVFDLPELLHTIISHLVCDGSSAYRILLVNKTFFPCAVKFIWNSVPLHVLGRIHDDRKEKYFEQIRDLYLEPDFEPECRKIYIRIFQNLKLPRLRSLKFDSVRIPWPCDDEAGSKKYRRTIDYCSQFLLPSLEAFAFRSSPYSLSIGALLDQVLTCCPRLQDVKLAYNHPTDTLDLSPQLLARFLQNIPFLRSCSLLFGGYSILTEEVLVALARRPGLRRLSVVSEPLQDNVAHAVTERFPDSQPFPSIQELDIVIKGSAGHTLLGKLTTLRVLTLTLTESSLDTFDAVGSLTGLVSLNVLVRDESELGEHHFRRLRSLSNLQRLTLERRWFYYLEGRSLAALLPDLSKLQYLVLGILTNFSNQELVCLGESCRFLRHLEIKTCVISSDGLSNIRRQLFPYLETFIISTLKYPKPPNPSGDHQPLSLEESDRLDLIEERTIANAIVRGLKHHCPRLAEVSIDEWWCSTRQKDYHYLLAEAFKTQMDLTCETQYQRYSRIFGEHGFTFQLTMDSSGSIVRRVLGVVPTFSAM